MNKNIILNKNIIVNTDGDLIINENSNMNSQALIEKLMSEADTWLAGKHNPDDITIVIIKHNI